MKSFSVWLVEREVVENKLTADVVKNINVDLFEFVKTVQPFDDLKEVVPQIEELLEKYNISLLGDDNKPFSDKIIISLGEKNFNLGSSAEGSEDSYQPYTNVQLNIGWGEKDNQFIIKDAALESK